MSALSHCNNGYCFSVANNSLQYSELGIYKYYAWMGNTPYSSKVFSVDSLGAAGYDLASLMHEDAFWQRPALQASDIITRVMMQHYM